MKKKFMCMLMAAAMTLSMAACGSKSDDTNTDDNAGGASDGVQTFTVGTSGPLTGDNAIYGMAVKQGVPSSPSMKSTRATAPSSLSSSLRTMRPTVKRPSTPTTT